VPPSKIALSQLTPVTTKKLIFLAGGGSATTAGKWKPQRLSCSEQFSLPVFDYSALNQSPLPNGN
jgi:hypothetical protein